MFMDAHFTFIIKISTVIAFVERERAVIGMGQVDGFWASWTALGMGFDFTPITS